MLRLSHVTQTSTQTEAELVWQQFKRPLLSSLHFLVSTIFLVLYLRGEPQRALLGTIFFSHAAAWLCCRATERSPDQGRARAFNQSPRLLAHAFGLLSWAAHTMAHYRFSKGAPLMTAVALRSYSNGWGWGAELIVYVVEEWHALMVLPAWATTAWLAVHFTFTYTAILIGGGQPGIVAPALWVSAQLFLPHLLHLYMKRSLRRDTGAADAASRACTLVCGTQQPSPSKDGVVDRKDTSGAPGEGTSTQPAGPQEQQQQQPQATDSTAADPAAVYASRTVSAPQPVTPGQSASQAALAVQLRSISGVPPTSSAMQSLRNAKALVKRGSSCAAYRSRLTQPQAVTIKLEDTEPEQLAPDVVSALNSALNGRYAGSIVARACVRKGCTLLVLDVLQTLPGQGLMAGALDGRNLEMLQECLQSLLAPGTVLRDGAVAHISLGAQQVKATWHQEQRSWVLEQASATAGLPSVNLSLLHVDHPVARLPAQAASVRGLSLLHRVSLVLQSTYAGRTLSFEGSDQTSAPPEQPAGSDALVVSCIARGSWGTCLPVTVAALEEEAALQEEDTSITDNPALLTALSLDVDLSLAPHGGVVQLELWCGRSLLASAPLLLLPPLVSAEGNPSDALLVELLQHTKLIKWGTQQGGTGIAAWLNDLGQLLHTAACCASGGTTADSASTGPGSWGGVVSAIARQHATSPALLSGALALGEGLLEYAKSEGLPHTSSLLSSTILNVHQRLEELQGTTSAAPAVAGSRASSEQPGPSDTPGKGSVRGLSLYKSWLRKRLPRPYASHLGGKAVHTQLSSHVTAQPTQPAAPTVKEAVRCTLAGFSPVGVEHQYQLWVAKSNQRMILMYSLLLCCWVTASGVRLATEGGLGALVDHLPLHLLSASPYLISLLLSLGNNFRWQEAGLIGHSIARSVAAVLAASFVSPPQTYHTICRIKLDQWGELGFYPFAEPMRLPALLVSHVSLIFFDLGLQNICGRQGTAAVLHGLAIRVLSLIIAAGLDASRRFTFLREAHSKATAAAAT